ncbi:uncharacterized protein LOC106086773 [Stomoxys calcitrans]|uniref:uncharacterized protein LOC106086773 n=1 Tax=Stomoxys calcitrans TaxID=35570 RepID=UPI0027E28F11|nr:uncharacterized protein LOC106086773 [Stomoxys calcitrans]
MMCRLKILIIAVTIIVASVHSLYVSIEQCPGTDVKRIRQQIQHHEISLIFYYTRWSADSLEALQEYNDVAVYYSDKIYFSSIDCWHLQCNCSRALNTPVGSGLPHKWPTLMAYYGSRGQLQIQYHGLWSFKDIQQFVHNLVYPLERLHTNEDLEQTKLVSDAVVIGIFKSPDSREYKQYLMAALKWLESDPLRTYRFKVIFYTNTTAAATTYSRLLKGDDSGPDILFMGASNITKRYAELQGHIWNATNILLWLHRELKGDLKKLHGYATPITIAQKLNQNSVLAVFVNQPHPFFTYMEEKVDRDKACSKIASDCWKRIQQNEYFRALGIQHILESLQIYTDNNLCYYNMDIALKNLGDYYEINSYLKFLVQNLAYPSSSKVKDDFKPNIMRLLNFHHITNCLNFEIKSSNSLYIATAKHLQAVVDKEAKLFNSNRTISVVVLDTERYKDYLQGLDMRPQSQSMASAFIIDMKQESIFPMTDQFDMTNFRRYLGQYYQRCLPAHFKSEHLKQLNNSSPRKAKSSLDSYGMANLNHFTFQNSLHYSHNQSLVLLIHSPECALCGTLQHTFIQISSALRSLAPELQFVRLNALLNDLPWQFNMASLPVLLVFPKHGFSDTRIFPSHLKPDFKNVFAFILKQLPAEDQIKTIVTFCQSRGLGSNHTQSCWRFAKNLLMQHISNHLHYWQLFENERSIIFQRLRAFKDMSLDVQRNLRL